jgi:hypothetical protein
MCVPFDSSSSHRSERGLQHPALHKKDHHQDSGRFNDDKASSIAMKGIALTGLDKKMPPVSQVAVTDTHGTFHFDSVPAGKYAITIDFTGVSVKKAEVHCATDNSCSVALVVKPVGPHDCYRPHYADDQVSTMRGSN